ncbi:N-acetylornithine carbamoyltransferase [Gammaproteobacteria bacterium]|nr:N-acetylornithine carbamoyltransferase [Gammaproteobacteria bacterium]
MKNFISTQSWSRSQLQDILDFARSLKENPYQPLLKNKSVAMLFFNPSLRTKTSFEIGISELQGTAVILQPGKDAWPIEFKDHIEMNGGEEEHVKEVAQVLSSYCDCIAIRAFPAFEDWSIDRTDHVINSFAKYATVPVVNMETIEHPCQELAHILTLQEHYGDLQGKDYLLTWTYHPKPLNTAVANSSLLIASKFGMNVKLLCPSEDYLLDERYINAASKNCLSEGTSFSVTHDIESAYSGAEIVYAKSWGSLVHYGNLSAELNCRKDFKHFIVDEKKMGMTNNAVFSHCLPLRRNVKATDAVMDADYCLAVKEAANRKHVQKSMLTKIL